MNIILLALIVVVLLVLAVLIARAKGAGKQRGSYKRIPYLLSKAERSFYGVLVQAVEARAVIFAKVRVADVLAPQKGIKRPDWQRAFNAISAKHFDFLICDKDTTAALAAVELDDASHNSKSRIKRDQFLGEACESAGLPLIRVKAARTYVLNELKSALAPYLEPHIEEQSAQGFETRTPGAELSPAESGNNANDESAEEPKCPKCGSDMVRRVAKAGANEGKTFWGCSAFPKCRAVLEDGAATS